MKCFLTAAASALASFRSAQVFGLRQFVSGKIDDVILGPVDANLGMHLGELQGQSHQQNDEQDLNAARSQHAAVGKQSTMRLARQSRLGALCCRTDGRTKLIPRRWPLNE